MTLNELTEIVVKCTTREEMFQTVDLIQSMFHIPITTGWTREHFVEMAHPDFQFVGVHGNVITAFSSTAKKKCSPDEFESMLIGEPCTASGVEEIL